MQFSPLIQQLITALRCLPGVGPKSAQRMAFHLLERDQGGALRLAKTLTELVDKIGRCESCRSWSETPVCGLCSDETRDRSLLCVLESPVDQFAIEQSGSYRGGYFILSGHLSPIDGIGPDQLGIAQLLKKLQVEQPKELIIATNPTVEGEATAHYIGEQVRSLGIQVTRIAHGVPVGGELEFVDGGTLSHAMSGRRNLF